MNSIVKFIIVVSGVCVISLAAMFAMWVWPTAYFYYHERRGDVVYLIRIDRITGKADRLGREGWYEMKPRTPPQSGHKYQSDIR